MSGTILFFLYSRFGKEFPDIPFPSVDESSGDLLSLISLYHNELIVRFLQKDLLQAFPPAGVL